MEERWQRFSPDHCEFLERKVAYEEDQHRRPMGAVAIIEARCRQNRDVNAMKKGMHYPREDLPQLCEGRSPQNCWVHDECAKQGIA